LCAITSSHVMVNTQTSMVCLASPRNASKESSELCSSCSALQFLRVQPLAERKLRHGMARSGKKSTSTNESPLPEEAPMPTQLPMALQRNFRNQSLPIGRKLHEQGLDPSWFEYRLRSTRDPRHHVKMADNRGDCARCKELEREAARMQSTISDLRRQLAAYESLPPSVQAANGSFRTTDADQQRCARPPPASHNKSVQTFNTCLVATRRTRQLRTLL
jgi:hypothetical protein